MARRAFDYMVTRLIREADSVTVSYRRDDGTFLTVVGYGDSFIARMADADDQLPAGVWKRECVSTPASIYVDMQGTRNDTRHAYGAYEGKVIHV